MENSSTEFSVKIPTWTNTSGFEQSVEVRTGTKSESGLVNGFPSTNISPGRRIALFSLLFSCHILQTLAFYYVNDVKIHTSEHLKDLGSHFSKTAFGLSVWIQIHINIDFTKFGATAFIVSVLRLRCVLIWYTSLPRTILLSQLRGSYCFLCLHIEYKDSNT